MYLHYTILYICNNNLTVKVLQRHKYIHVKNIFTVQYQYNIIIIIITIIIMFIYACPVKPEKYFKALNMFLFRDYFVYTPKVALNCISDAVSYMRTM